MNSTSILQLWGPASLLDSKHKNYVFHEKTSFGFLQLKDRSIPLSCLPLVSASWSPVSTPFTRINPRQRVLYNSRVRHSSWCHFCRSQFSGRFGQEVFPTGRKSYPLSRTVRTWIILKTEGSPLLAEEGVDILV